MKTGRVNGRGFTMTELIVAMTVLALVITTATTFYIEIWRGHYIVEQRINQAIDIRHFSQELVFHASRANQFYLYRSASSTDFASPSNELKIDASDASNILHPAGDFIVFVYYETPKPLAQTYYRIQKLVGYYLDTTSGTAISGGTIGTVTRITIDLSQDLTTSAATLSTQVADYDTTTAQIAVEEVLAAYWSSTTHSRKDKFLLQARGLFETETSSDTTGRLFYYSSAQNVIVAGQAYGTSQTQSQLTYTDTFNFSITPRS